MRTGVGSVPHLLGLRLADAAGIALTHIPYQPVEEIGFQPKWSGSMLRATAAA
jgi:tripartite-type tricarboxylate transporter receptor subunit TctC